MSKPEEGIRRKKHKPINVLNTVKIIKIISNNIFKDYTITKWDLSISDTQIV